MTWNILFTQKAIGLYTVFFSWPVLTACACISFVAASVNNENSKMNQIIINVQNQKKNKNDLAVIMLVVL